MKRPTILVLGAGYGGLTTVVNLQKQVGTAAEIILINKNDYHYETTWLHEVGAGSISPEEARYPISKVINNDVQFVQATVESIDVATKSVGTTAGQFTYDYLVLGLGFEGETFGIPGLKEYALSLTNINTARQVREHIEYQFASWSLQEPEHRDDSKLTIVVGGAGFTGIEFLGELGNRVPKLCKEFDVPKEKVRILCVEAAPMVLPGFDPELVEYAKTKLAAKGIEFSIGTPIVEATPEGVKIKKAEEQFEFIKAGTVVWAAGVRGNALVESSGIESNRARIAVTEDLRAPGYDDVFVVGDCAFLLNEETGRPYPPTAQIAMQQAVNIAKNVRHLLNGEDTEKFVYDDKGAVCSLGDGDAIGSALGRKFTGKTANALKKIIDDRALLLVGGPGLVLKKGKFNFL